MLICFLHSAPGCIFKWHGLPAPWQSRPRTQQLVNALKEIEEASFTGIGRVPSITRPVQEASPMAGMLPLAALHPHPPRNRAGGSASHPPSSGLDATPSNVDDGHESYSPAVSAPQVHTSRGAASNTSEAQSLEMSPSGAVGCEAMRQGGPTGS